MLLHKELLIPCLLTLQLELTPENSLLLIFYCDLAMQVLIRNLGGKVAFSFLFLSSLFLSFLFKYFTYLFEI